MEELADLADRRVRLALQRGGAAHVDGAVEIEVVDVAIVLAADQTGHGLVANAQYFRARADRRDVLEAPPDFVIEAQARDGCAVGVELRTLRSRHDVANIGRERHFYARNQI